MRPAILREALHCGKTRVFRARDHQLAGTLNLYMYAAEKVSTNHIADHNVRLLPHSNEEEAQRLQDGLGEWYEPAQTCR